MRAVGLSVILGVIGCDVGAGSDRVEATAAREGEHMSASANAWAHPGDEGTERTPPEANGPREVTPGGDDRGAEVGTVDDASRTSFEHVVTVDGVDCFAADAIDGGAAAVIVRAGGRVEIAEVAEVGEAGVTTELVQAEDAQGREPAACALSMDRDGRPEIAIAWVGGDTVHLALEGARWVTSRIAPFEAARIAMNAKSPRGTEVIAVDGWLTAVHAVREGDAWRVLALPAVSFGEPGAMAIAVTADAEGRSHFALGADYYGDRDGQYVFWPGARAEGDAVRGGLAIALSPDAERLPHIVHARTERAAGGWEQAVTHLYHTVIGPDAAMTTRWATGATVVGHDEHIAAGAGQLAAGFDANGRLFTVAGFEVRGTRGARWGLRRDRAGAGAEMREDIHATGEVVLAGELVMVQSDRALEVYRQGSAPATNASAAASGLIAPPSVGSVGTCRGGYAEDGAATTLRRMHGVSHVVLASAPEGDEVHAVEWAWDREAVRHALGHEAGWDTRDVASWQLEVDRPRQTRAVVGADGATHLVWPRGEALEYASDASGRWVREEVPVLAGAGAPSLSVVGQDVWVAAVVEGAQGAAIDVARRRGGAWVRAEEVIETRGALAAHTLVAARDGAVVLVAERVAGDVRVVAVARGEARWERRDLGVSAARIESIAGVAVEGGVVALVAAVDASGRREITVIAIPEARPAEVVARWSFEPHEDVEALHVGVLDGPGVAVLWRRGASLEGARVDTAGVSSLGRVTTGEGGRVLGGLVTPAGRLVAAVHRGADAEIIGAACAPVAPRR